MRPVTRVRAIPRCSSLCSSTRIVRRGIFEFSQLTFSSCSTDNYSQLLINGNQRISEQPASSFRCPETCNTDNLLKTTRLAIKRFVQTPADTNQGSIDTTTNGIKITVSRCNPTTESVVLLLASAPLLGNTFKSQFVDSRCFSKSNSSSSIHPRISRAFTSLRGLLNSATAESRAVAIPLSCDFSP